MNTHSSESNTRSSFRKMDDQDDEGYEMVQDALVDDRFPTVEDLTPSVQYSEIVNSPAEQQVSPAFKQVLGSEQFSLRGEGNIMPDTAQFTLREPESNRETVEKLSVKVRAQAEQILALENYRIVCEKRIVELQPGHPLPISPAHLGLGRQNNSAKLMELSALLQVKEEEIARLQDQTMSKHTSRSDVTHGYHSLHSKRDEFIPQTEDMNANYNILYGKYKAMIREKEALEDSLSQETMSNEKQRVYIQVLKQLLDQKLDTLGFPRYEKEKDRVDWVMEWRKNLEQTSRAENELVKLNQVVTTLQEEVEHFQTQADNLQKKGQVLIKENHEDKEKVVYLERLAYEQEEELRVLKAEKSQLLTYIDQNNPELTNRKLTDCKAQLEGRDTEINTLKHQLQSLRTQHESLQITNKQLELTTAIVTQQESEQLHSSEIRVEQLREDKEQRDEEIKTLREQHYIVVDSNNDLREEVERLQKELDKLQAVKEEKESEQQHRVETHHTNYSNQISTLSHQLVDLQSREYESQKSNDELNTTLQHYREKLRSIEQENYSTQAQLTQQRSLYEELVQAKGSSQKKLIVTEQQVVELKGQAAAARKEAEKLKSLYEAQKKSLEEAQAREKGLELKINSKGEEILSLEGIIADTKRRQGVEMLHKGEEIKELVESTQCLRTELQELRRKVEKAESSLLLKEEEVSLVNNRLDKKLLQIKTLEKEVRSLQQASEELKETQHDLLTLRTEHNKVLKSLKSTELELEERTQEHRTLAARFGSTEKGLFTTRGDLQEAERERANLKAIRQELGNVIEDREAEIRALNFRVKSSQACIEELERRLGDRDTEHHKLADEKDNLLGTVKNLQEYKGLKDEAEDKLRGMLTRVQNELLESLRHLRGRVTDMLETYTDNEIEEALSLKFREVVKGLSRYETEKGGEHAPNDLSKSICRVTEALQSNIETILEKYTVLRREREDDRYRIKDLEQRCLVASAEEMGVRSKETTLRRELKTLREENLLTTLEKKSTMTRESRVETQNIELKKELRRVEAEYEELRQQLQAIKGDKLRTTLEFKAHTQTLEAKTVHTKDLEATVKLLQREQHDLREIIMRLAEILREEEVRRPVLELLNCTEDIERLEKDQLRLCRQLEEFESSFQGATQDLQAHSTGYYRSLRVDMGGLKRNVEDNSLSLNKLTGQKKQLVDELKTLAKASTRAGLSKRDKENNNEQQLKEEKTEEPSKDDKATLKTHWVAENTATTLVATREYGSTTLRARNLSMNAHKRPELATTRLNYREDAPNYKSLKDRLSQTRAGAIRTLI